MDGTTGFTGGVGIAELWTGNGQDPGAVLHGDTYVHALEAAGTDSAQLFRSSPTGGSDSMALMYLLAITAAEPSIDLSSA